MAKESGGGVFTSPPSARPCSVEKSAAPHRRDAICSNIFSSKPLKQMASFTPTSRMDLDGSFRPSRQSRKRIWKAGNAAVSFQEVLKHLLADDEPLRLSQGFLSCIFPVNQQALEYLSTGSADTAADRVELEDVLRHVFVHVEGVDDRVDFERHFVLLAPVADLVEVVNVALLSLSSANQLVGGFIKTVTGDGKDVQIELEAPLGFNQRQDEGCFCSVEAKSTFVITLACEMIVDTSWSRHILGSALILHSSVNRCHGRQCSPTGSGCPPF
ncbi:hypothetical protein EYF80_009535 [Liparis tanakae]|uniref:Uncharacterized protein n=1 Tax=Liparis tanakae TaxID=230148 RepID=A0A4Z2IQD9_9TELE|nr:hypothetical protein EYF80_009535 [Liparis tanakae]